LLSTKEIAKKVEMGKICLTYMRIVRLTRWSGSVSAGKRLGENKKSIKDKIEQKMQCMMIRTKG